MKLIKKYELFLEVRLADVLNIKSDTDLSKQFKELKDKEYDFSKELLKFMFLDQKENGKKVSFRVFWNDNALHKIQNRLKDRTSFKSAEEFNEVLKETINKIFPSMVGENKELNANGRYAIYLKEYNLTIVIGFRLSNYLNNNRNITIYTILSGKQDNGERENKEKQILKLIEIE